MSLRRPLFAFLSLSLLLSSSFVLAESNIGFNGIGGRLGYVMPEGDLDGTFNFGVVADLGEWMDNLGWEAAVTYWSSSEDLGVGEFSVSDIAIKTAVKYFFEVGDSQIRPFAGAGIGMHMFKSEWQWTGHPLYGSHEESESDSEFGFSLHGGAEMPLSDKLKGQAEVELDFADLDQTHIQATVIYLLGK